MAYNGYLIKVGDYKIPFSMMRAETYSDVLNSQDLDSYRDSNGELHRDVLEHVVPKIEFEIPALKTNIEITDFFAELRKHYINGTAKDMMITSYVSEWGDYITLKMYLSPSIQFPIYYADEKIIKYNQIRVAFIGY